MSNQLWKPSIREFFYQDFEDRLNQETGENTENAWVLVIPAPLENGEDMSYWWFWQQAGGSAEEDNQCLEDIWLRKAAQRGSWGAMQALAQKRYELGHLEESLRWNFRLLTSLLDSASNLSDLNPQPVTYADWQEEVEGTVGNIAFLVGEGISIGDGVYRNNPQDLGKKKDYPDFTYCLKCGAFKNGLAPIEQCDDSVHASLRNFGN